jgi:hypothetical protein
MPTVPTPTPPVPATDVSFPTDRIAQWVQATYNAQATNVRTFVRLTVGPNDLVGYLLESGGLTCIGFILITPADLQIWNGDVRCKAADSSAIAGAFPVALTNNEFYVVSYIYVDPAAYPNANATSFIFPDGSSIPAGNDTAILQDNAFLAARAGLVFPTTAFIYDANANNLAQLTVQVQ